MLEGGRSLTNRFPRSIERKRKERPMSMPLESSSSDGEIRTNSAVLTPLRTLYYLVRTRKGATIVASTIRNNSSYLENMKGVFSTVAESTFLITIHDSLVIICRCAAIVFSGRFIHSSMSVRQTEGVLVIEQV